jgi:hypothetical protein
MKELDDFTVERLQEIETRARVSIALLNGDEVAALARIALAAKTAEPVALRVGDRLFSSLYSAGCYSSEMKLKIEPLYLDAQPNSPELPDGWKLVPIDLINDLRNAAHFEKASYAASFGSHIDTGRWKDEYEQLTATCKAVDDLLAPPTTEK